MKKIGIVFGGTSVEHDVSVITGVMISNTLNKEKFDAVPIYVDKDGKWFTGEELLNVENYKDLQYKRLTQVSFIEGDSTLYFVKGKKIKPYCVLSACINCLHGERGEDGALCGILNMCKVPLASPDILPSAISINKAVSKIVFKGLNVKTLPCFKIKNIDDIDKIKEKLVFPVIVKPNKLGSSIGIKKADDINELYAFVLEALRYDDTAIVEKCLSNFTEINCAAYSGVDKKTVVSLCERPVGKEEILSFSDKYQGGDREFPAKIPIKLSNKIQAITKKVYEELEFTGVIRIDYFIIDGEVYLNEINAVPGSLAYYLFKDTLKEFSFILEEEIKRAEKDYALSTTLKKEFKSSILDIKGIKGGKVKKRL